MSHKCGVFDFGFKTEPEIKKPHRILGVARLVQADIVTKLHAIGSPPCPRQMPSFLPDGCCGLFMAIFMDWPPPTGSSAAKGFILKVSFST